jgi:hypothetical protein
MSLDFTVMTDWVASDVRPEAEETDDFIKITMRRTLFSLRCDRK